MRQQPVLFLLDPFMHHIRRVTDLDGHGGLSKDATKYTSLALLAAGAGANLPLQAAVVLTFAVTPVAQCVGLL